MKVVVSLGDLLTSFEERDGFSGMKEQTSISIIEQINSFVKPLLWLGSHEMTINVAEFHLQPPLAFLFFPFHCCIQHLMTLEQREPLQNQQQF